MSGRRADVRRAVRRRGQELLVIRALRLLRVFRVLSWAKYLAEAGVLPGRACGGAGRRSPSSSSRC
jgi:hypothetical protein